MEFRQLQYFVAVAEEESFSRAAEKMNVSQPSLSKAIQSIEDEYGVTLVKRTTRSFKLTDAGELIFKQGEKLIDDYEQLKDKLSELSSDYMSEIRIGIPPVLNTIMASDMLSGFSKQHPRLKLLFTEMGSKPIISNVIKGELDVGFVLLPDDCSELSVRRIMSDEIVLVVPEGHELAKYKAISIRLLKDIPLIMLDSTYQIYDNVMRAFDRAGIEPNIIALSKSWDYIVELVRLSHGITILPRPILKKTQGLVSVPFIEPFSKWQIVAITKKGEYIPARVENMINYFQKIYKKR